MLKAYRDNELELLNFMIQHIKEEHKKQIKKWGIQTHSIFEWNNYLTEELGELSEALADYEYERGGAINAYMEAIQVATLSLKIAEMMQQEVRKEMKK